MDERSQGTVEYLLVLAAVLVVVAGIVASIFVASRGLGSTIGDQIENARKEVIDGLVGALRLLG